MMVYLLLSRFTSNTEMAVKELRTLIGQFNVNQEAFEEK